MNLDVSGNLLSGALPTTWGGQRAFPKLETLSIYGNNLGASSSGEVLISSWANGFPGLDYLVLQPGNPHICSAGVTPQPIGGGAAYDVVDANANKINLDITVGCA